jgi:hypothetical protein
LLRVLLVLSLWHAPIPWVHSHDLDGPDVARLTMLSEHVAAFHAREVGLGQQHLEWHLHLVLPWCMIHHLPCPESDDHRSGPDDFIGGAKLCAAGTNSEGTVGAPRVRSFLAGDLGCCVTATSFVFDGPGASIQPPACPLQFFATYGATSVRDLVGVRLC